MSDLINRSELIDYFYYGIDDKPIIDGISDRKIIDIIKNQPTAYSVAKVFEELESELEKGNIAIDFGEFRLFEIIKHGGVSDDVCEWKYNDTEYYWESSCDHLHIFISDGPKENWYEFCPYCGKKIKVVE